MEQVSSWLRNMVCFLCFFQVFLHLVPKEEYRKYLKFFGNLLLIFIVLRPVSALLGKGEALDQILRTQSLKGTYSEIQMHMEGIEELKTGVVNRAFQEELKRQIRQIPEAYGLSVLKLELAFSSENRPEKLTMNLLWTQEGEAETVEAVREEISEIYGISQNAMEISVQG